MPEDDLFKELTTLTWHESIDKAYGLDQQAEGPADVVAFGFAFIIGSYRLEVTEQQMRDCFESLVRVWNKSGGKFPT